VFEKMAVSYGNEDAVTIVKPAEVSDR